MLTVDAHIVQLVRYLEPRGISGTKKSVKKVRTRMTDWAAGVWHREHNWKTVPSLCALLLNPKRMKNNFPPLSSKLPFAATQRLAPGSWGVVS
jgi:hypothetical protein